MSTLYSKMGANPLSMDEIRAVAPSVFAPGAHESRSARFAYIPTSEIITGLMNEGFDVVSARQGRCRSEDRRDFMKHELRLRPRGLQIRPDTRVGDTFPEVILWNANDGTSAYKLVRGLMTLRCLNGMMTWGGAEDEVRISHSGNVVHKVIDGAYRVISDAQSALTTAQEWAQIELDRDERMLFARAAHELRFGEAEEGEDHAIRADQMLVPRRREDAGDQSLWRQTNIIQEHMLRGGDRGFTRDADNRLRRVTTKPITSIDSGARLNRSLWRLAQGMATLKQGGTLDLPEMAAAA